MSGSNWQREAAEDHSNRSGAHGSSRPGACSHRVVECLDHEIEQADCYVSTSLGVLACKVGSIALQGCLKVRKILWPTGSRRQMQLRCYPNLAGHGATFARREVQASVELFLDKGHPLCCSLACPSIVFPKVLCVPPSMLSDRHRQPRAGTTCMRPRSKGQAWAVCSDLRGCSASVSDRRLCRSGFYERCEQVISGI